MEGQISGLTDPGSGVAASDVAARGASDDAEAAAGPFVTAQAVNAAIVESDAVPLAILVSIGFPPLWRFVVYIAAIFDKVVNLRLLGFQEDLGKWF
ncbi:MAG: hypothetical protein ABJ205_15640 [Erythrobacter sp.]|uniref:hypothetical protein n=1 Tax=Erythrobacter sp. TaxID=1042 RepID=UPI003264A23E